jgi:serine/threonine-protein kinase
MGFVGRYAIYGEIAAGGMATVHFGRLFGTAGFSRTVAIKRLHPQMAKNPDFVAMFLDEAHVTARIRHANVVSTLDVVSMQGELFIVMDYVHGESLWRLVGMNKEGLGQAVPPRVAGAIVANVLHGLHAAHEATNESGEPLGIVHRDVSPQNVLVGKDGVARVLDFGIAKARDRMHVTRGGALKGKVSYMAPEQLSGRTDRRTDVYACGVVLWEALTGRKLFIADGDFAIADRVRTESVQPPSTIVPDAAPMDAIVMRALSKSPDERFADAAEMAAAIERVSVAPASEVAAWVQARASDVLEMRAGMLATIEKAAPAIAPDGTHEVALDPDPDGLAPTRAIDIGPQGEATEVSLARAVALAPPAKSSTRGARVALIAAGAVLGVVLGGVAVFGLMRKSDRPVAAATTASVPPTTASSAPPTVVSAPVASSSAPIVLAPPVVSAAPPLAASRHPIIPTPKVDCNPPYIVDARGIRHIKHECMK